MHTNKPTIKQRKKTQEINAIEESTKVIREKKNGAFWQRYGKQMKTKDGQGKNASIYIKELISLLKCPMGQVQCREVHG